MTSLEVTIGNVKNLKLESQKQARLDRGTSFVMVLKVLISVTAGIWDLVFLWALTHAGGGCHVRHPLFQGC